MSSKSWIAHKLLVSGGDEHEAMPCQLSTSHPSSPEQLSHRGQTRQKEDTRFVMSRGAREKSELSQYSFVAEKYHILKGTVRQGTDEPICRAATETQPQRAGLWTEAGKERVGRSERTELEHMQ